jgi:hypothetical protein
MKLSYFDAQEITGGIVNAVHSHLVLTLLLLSPLFFTIVRFCYAYGSRGTLYPPGPPTLPIIGNLLAFPRKYPQYKLGEWGEFVSSS